MSEQIKRGYCYACGRKDANIIYSGSGKNPTCMECNTDLDKHMGEWMPTEKEIDEMHDEYKAREEQRGREMYEAWKKRIDKKFEIAKNDLRPIF